MLDTLDADDTLTSEQKKQVSDLRKQLEEAQQSAQRQEENQQQQSEKRQEFVSRMDALEESDLKIASAATPEDELALTAGSFEQWDALLMEMYDYLAGVLNADQYASEEAAFDQWVQERDEGREKRRRRGDGRDRRAAGVVQLPPELYQGALLQAARPDVTPKRQPGCRERWVPAARFFGGRAALCVFSAETIDLYPLSLYNKG